ncbi:hypothetical protein [Hymenobacter sp. BT491]|uniref:hypothetical protein n=1 Tax=Hymenobacter sp. BT491 TaxID=2766779 RepID=UPI001653E342|nr:hypothetical protein [Hymenobacter sp. BT491]MBC6988179.1 hypothetical protein [Hymenobacter sp. BT491]
MEIPFYLALGIVGLIVGTCFYYLYRQLIGRFLKPRRHLVVIAALAAAITTPLLGWAGVRLTLYALAYYPHRDFNSKKWAADPLKRYEMMDDLLASQRLLGLSPPQVEALLGRPNLSNAGAWEYYLGMTPKVLSIDGDALTILFQNGKVIRCYIRET